MYFLFLLWFSQKFPKSGGLNTFGIFLRGAGLNHLYRPGDLLPYTHRGITRKYALLLGLCTACSIVDSPMIHSSGSHDFEREYPKGSLESPVLNSLWSHLVLNLTGITTPQKMDTPGSDDFPLVNTPGRNLQIRTTTRIFDKIWNIFSAFFWG